MASNGDSSTQSHTKVASAKSTSKIVFREDLAEYLVECGRTNYPRSGEVRELLGDRPNAEALQAITNQFAQAFMHTLQVKVKVTEWHAEIDRVPVSEFTLHQAFKGDFAGEVYLNLTSDMMLRTASKLLAEQFFSVDAIVTDAACELLNIINGNSCAQMSASGINVEVQPPLCYCHPGWGERAGTHVDFREELERGVLTVVTLTCPKGNMEVCIVDRTEP